MAEVLSEPVRFTVVEEIYRKREIDRTWAYTGRYPSEIEHFGIKLMLAYLNPKLVQATLTGLERKHGKIMVADQDNNLFEHPPKSLREGQVFNCVVNPGYEFLAISSLGEVSPTVFSVYNVEPPFTLNNVNVYRDLK